MAVAALSMPPAAHQARGALSRGACAGASLTSRSAPEATASSSVPAPATARAGYVPRDGADPATCERAPRRHEPGRPPPAHPRRRRAPDRAAPAVRGALRGGSGVDRAGPGDGAGGGGGERRRRHRRAGRRVRPPPRHPPRPAHPRPHGLDQLRGQAARRGERDLIPSLAMAERALFRATVRALLQPKRLAPILLVSAPLVA